MNTNTGSYAERELSILTTTVKDSILTPFVPEILALCEKFGANGDSGGSAPFTAAVLGNAIKTLCLQKPICDITGIDEEWLDVSQASDGLLLYQNKRCYAAFKIGDGQAYYLDAIVFKSEDGITHVLHHGAYLKDGSRLASRQDIKKFPFKPKTFYIDVITKPVSEDDWEYEIKDENQLKAVRKYYDVKPA